MNAPSLSAFDLGLNFNPALISVSKTVFGSSMTPFDQLDIGGAGSTTQVNQPSPGNLHLIEVSLDTPRVLDNQQLGGFTLGEITFRGVAPGTSALSLAVNALGDSQGNPLSPSTLTGASLTVSGTATPEPQSWRLLGAGLLALLAGKGRLVGTNAENTQRSRNTGSDRGASRPRRRPAAFLAV